ncbi:zinc-dependent metalloprotease [Flagellimonas sp.]|jgi:hypothetical protein|uniref:zinc-dependent metalloprotease n=1 Tax=Flagellimonas sp. TaxID=2058762 RepID=UPI000B62847B|nr:MAG: DUF5117 domain-containing protein [Muricauda sp. TMED12]
MKAIRIPILSWSGDMKRYVVELSMFVFFVLAAACPLWGQANFGIQGHLEKDRLIFELEKGVLDTPMLFVRHDAGQLQVQWSEQNGFIQLSVFPVRSEAGVTIPQYRTTKIPYHILGRFPIQNHGKDEGHYRIDVTSLFLSAEVPWGLMSMETVLVGQSYIEGIRFLDDEVIIDTKRTAVYMKKQRTVSAAFSFYKLPEVMRPRLFDHRMGFTYEDLYSPLSNEPWTELGSIMRWRLVKKHKDRSLSKPVKPIVFYLDPSMPKQLRPYVRAGVLEWLPAFEAAGFKNAIVVRNLPKDSMDLAKHSVNYSIIRWRTKDHFRGHKLGGSTVEKIVDIRSGEILKADIILGTSIEEHVDSYFVCCAPMDDRARYPFPDELIGRLIQSTVAHEAGHAFGIKDGNFGEFAYPLEKVRSVAWLRKMGHTPSVMNYSRNHHIAQPEDSIPVDLLIQRVGPLDRYHIQWGYMPIVGAKKPADEFPVLDDLVRKQDTFPWLRNNASRAEILGPGLTDEVADNDSPIQSTILGLKNLKRVIALIPKINQGKKDHELLLRLHKKTLDFWYRQMERVLSMVGGYEIRNISGGQTGTIYTPLALDEQRQAMEFLLEHVFEVPRWLSHPDYRTKVGYTTNSDYLLNRQLRLLQDLFNARRMDRLEFMEENYFKDELLASLFQIIGEGLFKELERSRPIVTPRRQRIQQACLKLLTENVDKNSYYNLGGLGRTSAPFSDYSKSVMTFELMELEKMIEMALKRTRDRRTKGHLLVCSRILADLDR